VCKCHLFYLNYEFFDLSKTHFLSTQDLVKIFIDLMIQFLKKENSFKKSEKSRNKKDNYTFMFRNILTNILKNRNKKSEKKEIKKDNYISIVTYD